MAQIKIYGLRPHLDLLKTPLSAVIYACVVTALPYAIAKRIH